MIPTTRPLSIEELAFSTQLGIRISLARRGIGNTKTKSGKKKKTIQITQKQLASHLHTTRQKILYFESGRKIITAYELLKIAEFLNVPINYLYYGSKK